MITSKIALILAPFFLAGQTKPADDTAKAPTIPLALESEYYRADSVFAHAKATADAASVDLQAAVAALQKLCGDKFIPFPQDKHLKCIPKPDK